MKTLEEKSHDHAKQSGYPSVCIESELTAFIAGYNLLDGESQWVNSIKETPSIIDGHDYSENVLGIVEGQLGVYCYCRLISETPEESGYFWANCYNDINGDAEWDNEYNVTHWMPLPVNPIKTIDYENWKLSRIGR